MAYLILGFLLGVGVSWFWQSQYNGVPVFQQLMQKELAVNGQLGSVTVLKKRLETLEKRLAEMETQPGSEELLEAVEPPKLLAVGSNIKNPVPGPQPVDRKKTRGKVLAMWKDGKPVTEIATHTRLGKGEVELIISLEESR